MTINVLGTDYIIDRRTVLEDIDLAQKTAYCDVLDKRIVVRTDEGYTGHLSGDQVYDKVKSDYLHELVHAHLWEAGLETHYDNEPLVCWVTNMLPKLIKCMKDAGYTYA